MLDLIKEQLGSDGKKGWPVANKDRIAFSNQEKITKANVAVAFLWTMRDNVVPYLEKDNLAMATNFYTPSGLGGMIRNILSNPYIRYVIMLGEEYATRPNEEAEQTSANALRHFFNKGINENKKLEGFEQSIHFDKHIPVELINRVKENITVIDLNKQMPGSSLTDKIKEANRLLKNLERKEPFLDKPYTFDYEKITGAMPYEGGPIVVHGSTIPKTWIHVIHNIYRHGRDSLMDANTDRWVKEINNLVAVIHDPQSLDLSINPFLVPITLEKIKAYQNEVLSPLLPQGKAYTYGNKLRAYFFPDSDYIQNLLTTKEFKDFEFGQGSHLHKNIRYLEKGCEIDQIKDIIEALKKNKYLKSCVAITWHPADELMRKHKSSPCLVLLQPLVQDDKLNLTVYFRSHDMTQGWPENAYGCAAIQKEIAEGIGIKPGIITIISSSAQIYNTYYKQAEEMLAKFRKPEHIFMDPRGNFIINIVDDKITITRIHPENNLELEKIEGKTAEEIRQKLAHAGDINTSHSLYLGMELMKAELALKNNIPYIQDRPLQMK